MQLTRQADAFTGQANAFIRQADAFTKQANAFTMQANAFTRQADAFTMHGIAKFNSLRIDEMLWFNAKSGQSSGSPGKHNRRQIN
jgi:hypothetical protein